MPKADRIERPAKKRNRGLKPTTQVDEAEGNFYRELYLNQDRKCGLSGTAMSETDSIYINDDRDILALEATLLDYYGRTKDWTSVDVSKVSRDHKLVEEYDHYEAWNPEVS